jgi:hypothetical protein
MAEFHQSLLSTSFLRSVWANEYENYKGSENEALLFERAKIGDLTMPIGTDLVDLKTSTSRKSQSSSLLKWFQTSECVLTRMVRTISTMFE